jgi:hypothetical protein
MAPRPSRSVPQRPKNEWLGPRPSPAGFRRRSSLVIQKNGGFSCLPRSAAGNGTGPGTVAYRVRPFAFQNRHVKCRNPRGIARSRRINPPVRGGRSGRLEFGPSFSAADATVNLAMVAPQRGLKERPRISSAKFPASASGQSDCRSSCEAVHLRAVDPAAANLHDPA